MRKAKLIPKVVSKNRILSVTVKHMLDDSPDTSWLGEYSNTRTSEFSIDRAHSEDCASVVLINKEAQQILIDARDYVAELQAGTHYSEEDNSEWEALEESYNLLDSLAEGMQDCDCGERGDMGRNEYRYFNPSFNYVGKDGKPTDGLTPEEVHKYVRQDYERMERLNRGDWSFIGVSAEAQIGIPQGNSGSLLLQTLHSGGLWGIESDSERSYIESEEKNQLADLRDVLLSFGFSRRAISQAFKSVKTVQS